MEEDDTNPILDVEEQLPASFFHASRTFPEDVSEASPDQPILAGDSMKKKLPCTNTQPGNSGKDDRQHNPSSASRRTRSPSPGLSRSGSCHSSMRQEERISRSRKRDTHSNQRRDYSLEAERNIPGFTSEASRRTRTGRTTTILERRFSPDRRSFSSFPCSRRSRRSHSRDRRQPARRDSRDSRDRRRRSRERTDHRDQRRGHHRSASRHHR